MKNQILYSIISVLAVQWKGIVIELESRACSFILRGWLKEQLHLQYGFQVLRLANGCKILSSEKNRNLNPQNATQLNRRLACIVDRQVNRGFGNTKMVVKMLQTMEYDVRVVYLEGLSLLEQAHVMNSDAEIFIMAHGAAQTNLVFMSPRSIMIEIFPYNYSPKYNWYTGLADSCGLKSIPMINKNSTAFQIFCPNFRNETASICMKSYACRACARSAPLWVEIDYLYIGWGPMPGVQKRHSSNYAVLEHIVPSKGTFDGKAICVVDMLQHIDLISSDILRLYVTKSF